MNEAEKIIKEIKDKEEELNKLKLKLDKLGLAGRKAVYFNQRLIGWSYEIKIDRLNIRVEGEEIRK